jgi:chromosome segregation ATPase
MEMIKNPKAIAVLTTALFVATLFWLLNMNRVNNSLQAGLEDEKLKSEQLLSEKLMLEKDLQKMKDQFANLRESNYDLSSNLKRTSEKLKSQEAEYNRMKKQNMSLAQIKKQREELLVLQRQLENEIQSLRTSNDDLQNKNKELTSAVASLEERNRILSEDLNRAMFASLDHSQLNAVRGKSEKLITKAKRVQKIIANFEVPANLKNLTFRVIDSNGYAVSQNNGSISYKAEAGTENIMASLKSSSASETLQKIQMVYTPKSKLKTGVYTVQILNDNLYVGSLKLKLK